MIEIIMAEAAFEYICHDCKQLRLSLDTELKKCGNCGSGRIVMGAVGTLTRPR